MNVMKFKKVTVSLKGGTVPKEPEEGDLKVWWIPQIPMHPFDVEVGSLVEAKKVLDVLAFYDLFQLANRIKPDYSNAGGCEVFREGEWEEWESADGDSIKTVEL